MATSREAKTIDAVQQNGGIVEQSAKTWAGASGQ
jgi:hypothetical protein